ncbi:TonB-dependent receptor domain-containing protein [Ochrobactrum sp. EDr1-4]|uniref:TonB-dependent receptor domain-containing protein n=1 Tax=Ochrobactrum sp. EDr1-4 TaxID=3368622 RepID=UPI003BA22851
MARPLHKKHQNKLAMTLLCTTAALVHVPFVVASHAQTVTEAGIFSFNISAKPLASAIADVGAVSGWRIAYAFSLPKSALSSAVVGNMAPEQAISRLLQGTNITYRVTGARSIILEQRIAATSGDVVGAGTTVLDTITVTSGAGVNPANVPYETPGSSVYLSAEQIERNRGTSPGDMFTGIAGVMNAETRNSGGVDINIRGIQGQGRAPVVVDGATQETTVYRGYNGAQSRSYIDPDFISSMSIEKGSSTGADANGAIGGVVRMSTINADDILIPGQTTGVRIKGGFNTNSAPVPALGTLAGQRGIGTFGDSEIPTTFGGSAGMDRPGFLTPTGGSGSVAIAAKTDNFEIVAAQARRKNGNYYAGTQGNDAAHPVYTSLGDGTTQVTNGGLNQYRAGEEVLNTSNSNDSLLLKGKAKSDDGHMLELGYNSYRSTYGEIMPTQIWTTFGSGPYQGFLHNISLDTYTAQYRWNPDDNDLIDLKVNAYYTDLQLKMNAATMNGSSVNPIKWYSANMRKGITAENTSKFDTALGGISFNYGAGYVREDMGFPDGYEYQPSDNDSFGPSREGNRKEWNVFASSEWKPTDWLTFSPGIRYSHYDSFDRNAGMSYNYEDNSYDVVYGEPIENAAGGWSPTATLTVEPVDGWLVYGKAGSVLRSPSGFETLKGFSVATTLQEVAIEPERNKSFELGTSYLGKDVFLAGDTLRLHGAYFDNHIDNFISRVGKSTQIFPGFYAETITMVNLDYVKTRGLELNADYDTGKYFAGISWNHYLETLYCAKPGTLKSTRSQCAEGGLYNSYTLQQVPPKDTITVNLGARFLDEKLTVGGRVMYVGKRNVKDIGDGSDDAYMGGQINPSIWNPYTLVDLYLNYKPNESWEFNVGIDNLTDRYYMDALNASLMPAPARTFRFDATTKFGSNAPLFSTDMWSDLLHYRKSKHNWSGFYFGGNIGYDMGRSGGTTTDSDGSTNSYTLDESANFKAENASFGLQGGYNYQLSNGLVAGFEADVSRPNLTSSTRSFTDGSERSTKQLQSITQYNYDWSAGLKGRLGYSFNNVLIYGSAGLALLNEQQVRSQYRGTDANLTRPAGNVTQFSFSEQDEKLRTGLLLGGGVEYALSDKWSVRADYGYTRFGRSTFEFKDAREGTTPEFDDSIFCTDGNRPEGCPAAGDWFLPVHIDGTYKNVNGKQASNWMDFHSVKIGLNYHF